MIKNKKGFTLVEISVTFIILAIVIAIASSLIIAGSNFLARNAGMSDAKFVGDSICDNITAQLTDATKLTVAPSTATVEKDDSAIKIENGRMFVDVFNNGYVDLYGDGFYGGFDVRISTEVSSGGKFVELTVFVVNRNSGKIAYKTGNSIKLVNMIACEKTATVVENDGENVAFIYNCNDIKGSLDELDKKVAALGYFTDFLTKQYTDLMKRYNAATGEQRTAIANTIDAVYPSSTGITPTAEDYYTLAKNRCGGDWPSFDLSILSGISAKPELYGKLNTSSLKIRPSYQVKNGEIVGVIYYAYLDQSGNSSNGAYLVYNDRNDDWYYFTNATNTAYDMSGYNGGDNSGTYTKDYLVVNYLETGDSVSGGTWTRITN